MLHRGNFSFRTIAAPGQGQYKEKGSRFLAFAYPVAIEKEIKDHLVRLEKAYFDARHHCYAWVLGADKTLFRAHDAGEPAHTAGDPILGQIRSRDLTNVLVVVARYFGGTKLGVGGLISAYKLAAAEALNHAVIIEKDLAEKFMITYYYSSTPEVMKLVKDFELAIEEQSFDEQCRVSVSCKLIRAEAAMEKLELLKALGYIKHYDRDNRPTSGKL